MAPGVAARGRGAGSCLPRGGLGRENSGPCSLRSSRVESMGMGPQHGVIHRTTGEHII